ncbi:MAG: tRNA1(Val) (adenine(37)-N6)-methyltransferase [Bacilli bacterium]
MEVKNFLLGYKDLFIIQNTEMFNFSLDSVLLPNFVTINPNINRILDIGTGNAPIPLILSKKTNAKIVGVEIQKEVFDLAFKSVELNNLSNRISLINDDILEYSKKQESDIFDVITCNPPFFKVNKSSKLNNIMFKTIARHESMLNLAQILKVARKLLKNNGIIALVHRPERLLEIVNEMQKNNIEPKKIQFVYPYENKDANILLIEGRKNGKPGLKILSPIYTHKADGEYTDMIKKYFQEE